MAMEICSENSTSSTLVMSPARISFSYDLSQSDAAAPLEHHLFRSNSSSSSGVDFDFCNNHGTCAQPSSSADELFSDGKILPIRIKETVAPPRREIQQPEVLSPDLPSGKGEIDEGLKETKGAISESEEKHSSKSFWRFKRSSSLNRGSGYGPSLCPLPLLSRSNSTGSATSQKQNSKKNHPSVSVSKTSLQYSSTSGNHQKPPLKKSYGSYGSGGGVPINPVLNVHSGNLFGLGSIFGKEKSKRK